MVLTKRSDRLRRRVKERNAGSSRLAELAEAAKTINRNRTANTRGCRKKLMQRKRCVERMRRIIFNRSVAQTKPLL